VLVQRSLSPDTIAIVDTNEGAAAVIASLSKKLAAMLSVEQTVIEDAVLDRERVRTTAFPNGAAIPHCRLPRLGRFGIGLMVLQQPVCWDSQGHNVDTVMMIVGPTENVSDHLRILANSSQMLDSSALRAKLKRAPDARSAHELVCAAEEIIEQRRHQVGMLREIRKDQENGTNTDFLADVANRFEW